MLTIEKINMYKKAMGDIDVYLRITYGRPHETKVSDTEWRLMNSIVKDTEIINNNEASQEYIDKFNQKLKEICDNEDNIKVLVGLGEYLKNRKHLFDTYLIPIIDFIIRNDISYIQYDASIGQPPPDSPYKNWYIGYAKNITMETKFIAMYWNNITRQTATIIIKHFAELGMNVIKFEENEFSAGIFLYNNGFVTNEFNFNRKGPSLSI